MKDCGQCVVFFLGFSLSSAHVAVVAVVSHHLLALVGDVGAHGREPFQGVEVSAALSVAGFVDDTGFPGKICHALLRKGSADDVACQVFHGLGMTGQDAGAGNANSDAQEVAGSQASERGILLC